MPSELQQEASRENGKQSHGPITPEGKAISSANSYKHGLTAKSILAPGESEEEYREHCKKLFASFDWKTGHEETQIQSYCNTQWIIQRCERLLGAATDPKEINIFSQHHARLQRSKDAILKEIRKAISDRETAYREEFNQAILIRRADRLAERPTDLTPFGFVFTVAELDKEITYENMYFQAQRAVWGHREPRSARN